MQLPVDQYVCTVTQTSHSFSHSLSISLSLPLSLSLSLFLSLLDYMQLPVDQYVCIDMPLGATLERYVRPQNSTYSTKLED
jgi:hypothetical protein